MHFLAFKFRTIFIFDYNKKYEIAVYLNIVWKSVEIPAWSQV